MENREYELKIMLSKDEYEYFYKKSTKDIVQTNYYFETSDFNMRKSKQTLRIREKNNNYEITLKSLMTSNSHDGIIDMKENSINLNKEDFIDIINNKTSINHFMSGLSEPLKLIGKLKTKRSMISTNDLLPSMELDENNYLGKIDYELEWEINESLYPIAIDYLKNEGIKLEEHITKQSKFIRFCDRLLYIDES
ncbi:MAG: CYTH domain-containing protein [Clostridiales bacterium]|nr:CYTH domain-containing protein [Clostridiales bacterium]